jgi:hypothetical protein
MVFRKNESRMRLENYAENMNIMRHMAINLIRLEASPKLHLNMKLKRCMLSCAYLLKIVGIS